MERDPYIVGLAGGSASGKTTLVGRLADLFIPSEVAILSQDNYYLPLSRQQPDKAGVINFDRPQAIDFRRLRADIRKLGRGEVVRMPEYTFNDPSRFPRWLEVIPARIVVVEGLFVFADPHLRRMFHWKLLVELQPEHALQRRLIRDMEERGMSRKEILYQWNEHVVPAYDAHLKPYSNQVDLRIDNSTDMAEGMEQIVTRFKQIIRS